MAEVLLDTNIILDYLNPDRPEHISAVTMFEGMLEDDKYKPVMSASTLKDAYYVLCRKYKPEALIRQRLHWLTKTVAVKPLTLEIIEDAFTSDEPDFEDALIRSTAESIGALAIITRDKAAFKNSPIPSMDAWAFSYEME